MDASTLLREARRQKGLTQSELATRVGLPQSTVGRIEAGLNSPKAETLAMLLRACDQELTAMPIEDGVDMGQVRELLRLTPAERFRRGVAAANNVRPFRGRLRGKR